MLHLFLNLDAKQNRPEKLQASSHLVLFTVSEDHPKYLILLAEPGTLSADSV
jgi:hypothetical protein